MIHHNQASVTSIQRIKKHADPPPIPSFTMKSTGLSPSTLASYKPLASRLRKLIAAGGPDMTSLIPSANAVRAWILRICNEQREEIKENLRRAQARISLSWDIWTTSNDRSLLGVCAHRIDTAGNRQEAVIAMPRVRSHNSDSIAAVLHTVINLYSTGDNIGPFQATTPPITIPPSTRFASGTTSTYLSKDCGASATLSIGENLNQFKQELEDARDLSRFKLWRKSCFIRKLHHLVVYICRSEQRTTIFSNLQRELAKELKTSVLRFKRDTGVR